MKLRECCTQEHLQEAVSQLLHTHRRLHTQPSTHHVSGCAWTDSRILRIICPTVIGHSVDQNIHQLETD